MKKNTKILCTLGPASNSRKILKKMLKKGMDMARINTAHGNTHEYYSMVRNVRAVGKIPIVIDVKGPEVRLITNKMRNDYDNVKLKNGQTIKVGFSQDDDFFLNHNIYSDIMENDKVFIDNGKIETKVIKKACGYIHLKTNAGGVLKDRRGVNVPKRRLNVRKLSGRDIEAINFAIKNKAEYIALSFTRDKEDILNLKNKLKGTKIKIIAKIENEEGFKNLDSFIGLCDGIMVARGDLGVEMPLEDIPIIQKEIINKCNKKMKMDIVATQMMESMTENSIPTRAEASDVANAVLDGADVLMLSGETSIGKYPVEVVAEMARIIHDTEEYARKIKR